MSKAKEIETGVLKAAWRIFTIVLGVGTLLFIGSLLLQRL